jgi:hypothetical protein
MALRKNFFAVLKNKDRLLHGRVIMTSLFNYTAITFAELGFNNGKYNNSLMQRYWLKGCINLITAVGFTVYLNFVPGLMVL